MPPSTQISKALLGDDQRLKLPRFLEEEKDPEQTKQDLIDKIAQVSMASRHSCDAYSQPRHIPSAHAATPCCRCLTVGLSSVPQLNASIDEVAGKLKVPEGASNNSPVAEAMKLKT